MFTTFSYDDLGTKLFVSGLVIRLMRQGFFSTTAYTLFSSNPLLVFNLTLAHELNLKIFKKRSSPEYLKCIDLKIT